MKDVKYCLEILRNEFVRICDTFNVSYAIYPTVQVDEYRAVFRDNRGNTLCECLLRLKEIDDICGIVNDIGYRIQNELHSVNYTPKKYAEYSNMYRSRVKARRTCLEITNVIFNCPATIVFWSDGTKTVVKAHEDEFDPEKGLAMAISKKFLGNQGNYYNEFKKWLLEKKEETFIFGFDASRDFAKACERLSVELTKYNKTKNGAY